jgi:hypothetical protein
MTTLLLVAALLVGAAAAARSTWSPCGLSMLATVTPMAERGRGHRYGPTASWFIAGGVMGGATLGLVMAALAVLARALDASTTALAVAAFVAAAVTTLAEAGVAGFRLPVHRRQVNERWLDGFRPWVYGIGFGWQVGSGLATYIMTPAVYLTIVLAALTGRPWAAWLVGTVFGLLRGLAVLLGRHITGPDSLTRFHRRFHVAEPKVKKLLVVVEVAATLAFATVVDPWLGAVSAVVAAAVAAGARRRPSPTPAPTRSGDSRSARTA